MSKTIEQIISHNILFWFIQYLSKPLEILIESGEISMKYTINKGKPDIVVVFLEHKWHDSYHLIFATLNIITSNSFISLILTTMDHFRPFNQSAKHGGIWLLSTNKMSYSIDMHILCCSSIHNYHFSVARPTPHDLPPSPSLTPYYISTFSQTARCYCRVGDRPCSGTLIFIVSHFLRLFYTSSWKTLHAELRLYNPNFQFTPLKTLQQSTPYA